MRMRWGRFVAEHMKDFNEVIGSLSNDPDTERKRVKANQLLYICEACGIQAQMACMELAPRLGLTAQGMRQAMEAAANESVTAGTNVVSHITTFTTQSIHTALDLFPRLLSNGLCSVQPLTGPTGFAFAMKHFDETGRDLSDLDTFDQDYTEDPGEGEQIKKVRTRLTKESVEIEYRKLMHEYSHEVNVALKSQYGMNIEAINDGVVNREMAWEVDRVVIDRIVDFAGPEYFFDPTRENTYDSLGEVDQQAYDKNFVRKTLSEMETDMQATVYNQPNWALAGTDVIKFLKRLREYEAHRAGTNMGDVITTNGSVTLAGQMNGMLIYHDPQLDRELMLTGFTNNMDPFYAGFIFLPFGLASILTAAWTDPDVLLTKKARAMAFATKGIRSGQFAKVWLHAS